MVMMSGGLVVMVVMGGDDSVEVYIEMVKKCTSI